MCVGLHAELYRVTMPVWCGISIDLHPVQVGPRLSHSCQCNVMWGWHAKNQMTPLYFAKDLLCAIWSNLFICVDLYLSHVIKVRLYLEQNQVNPLLFAFEFHREIMSHWITFKMLSQSSEHKAVLFIWKKLILPTDRHVYINLTFENLNIYQNGIDLLSWWCSLFSSPAYMVMCIDMVTRSYL